MQRALLISLSGALRLALSGALRYATLPDRACLTGQYVRYDGTTLQGRSYGGHCARVMTL